MVERSRQMLGGLNLNFPAVHLHFEMRCNLTLLPAAGLSEGVGGICRQQVLQARGGQSDTGNSQVIYDESCTWTDSLV